MKLYSDKNIIESWLQNATSWIYAVQNNEIESRSLITNKAIIDAILEKNPLKVFDIGCGEGWLARELNSAGVDVYGIDIVSHLVEEANKQGGGKFEVLPYEYLSQETIKEKFDVAVCNFSLLGNESVVKLFQNIYGLLNENGSFIVQTIHPIAGCGGEEYKDGWRKGTWKGFNDSFTNPPPWYFRTIKTWKDLFLNNGFTITEIIEPLHPKTKTFASIIFIGQIDAFL